MVEITNLVEAEQVLADYIPQVKEMLGKDITLERMIPLMQALGNPQDDSRIIHIAGTSGKTSTAYYIASLLKQSGSKVGLTVSPHVDSVTERVQVGLVPLSEDEFCSSLNQFMKIIRALKDQPTYFELLMAFAYWYFAKIKVDYAVIETGLGGLQDASNIATNQNKVCVITDIGHDHMHVLGNTLEAIALQKAGIIHPANQVFMYYQTSPVNKVVSDYATKQSAILNMLSEMSERKIAGNLDYLSNLPLYQQRNWLLAKHVYDQISKRDNLPILSDDKLELSMNVQVPARMETITCQAKTLIMDGAHNQQKIIAFVASFQEKYPYKKAAIVLALKQGKEYEKVLPLLLPICSRLILTTFEVAQDLPLKSLEPAILAKAAKEQGFEHVKIIKKPGLALNSLLTVREELLIITGSFYLLSDIRLLLTK